MIFYLNFHVCYCATKLMFHQVFKINNSFQLWKYTLLVILKHTKRRYTVNKHINWFFCKLITADLIHCITVANHRIFKCYLAATVTFQKRVETVHAASQNCAETMQVHSFCTVLKKRYAQLSHSLNHAQFSCLVLSDQHTKIHCESYHRIITSANVILIHRKKYENIC